MIPREQIIIVSDENSRTTAGILANTLEIKYNISTRIWSSNNYIDKKDKINNNNIVICIGLNTITQRIKDSLNELCKSKAYKIKTKNNWAAVYGLRRIKQKQIENINNNNIAIILFIENYLSDFINNNFNHATNKDTENIYNISLKPVKKIRYSDIQIEKAPIDIGENEEQIETTSQKLDNKDETNNMNHQFKREMIRTGDNHWQISYYGKVFTVKEFDGLKYVKYLLMRPDQNFEAYELRAHVKNEDLKILKQIMDNRGVRDITKTNARKMISHYNDEMDNLNKKIEALESKADIHWDRCENEEAEECMKEIKNIEDKIKKYNILLSDYINRVANDIDDKVKEKENLKRTIKASIKFFINKLEDYPSLQKELTRLTKTVDGKFLVTYPDKDSEWHITN